MYKLITLICFFQFSYAQNGVNQVTVNGQIEKSKFLEGIFIKFYKFLKIILYFNNNLIILS
jgi:hypothetical protein